MKPVILFGGSGAVGSAAARHLRRLHPDLPLVIAGRDPVRVADVAADVGYADVLAVGGGFPEETARALGASAAACFYPDREYAVQRFAQREGIPYVTVCGTTDTMVRDLAVYLGGPGRAPVACASHWSAGLLSLLVIACARSFSSIERARVITVYDPSDPLGPCSNPDNIDQQGSFSTALVATGYGWRPATAAEADLPFVARDGIPAKAFSFPMPDVLTLGEALRGAEVRFGVSLGDSYGARRGGAPTHDHIIELTGTDIAGEKISRRWDVIDPLGQGSQTGLGAALVIERFLGLVAGKPVRPGFYFPENIVAPDHAVQRLADIGVFVEPAV